jgi:two-component system chemotaxis response regulator CheY
MFINKSTILAGLFREHGVFYPLSTLGDMGKTPYIDRMVFRLFCGMNDCVVPSTAEPAVLKTCQTNSRCRILVVDDEASIRLLLSEVLAGSGYHVDVAEDGAAAWEALQAKTYDLLITDQNMPKVTGIELVRNLRSAQMALPVVMVAGELPEHDPNRTPPLQLAATVLKPFALEALIDIVKSVLRGAIPPAYS